LGDFFNIKEYDLIIEQTFFCALPPVMRQNMLGMHELLLAGRHLLDFFF
jgi:hypothetical protein